MLFPPSTGRVLSQLTTVEPTAPRRSRRPKVPRLTLGAFEPLRRLLHARPGRLRARRL